MNMQADLDANTQLIVAVGRPTPATATTAGPTATLGPTGNAVAPS